MLNWEAKVFHLYQPFCLIFMMETTVSRFLIGQMERILSPHLLTWKTEHPPPLSWMLATCTCTPFSVPRH